MTNTEKLDLFYKWLGSRFSTFEVATPDTAPISFVANDPEGKQYYIYVNYVDTSILGHEDTGIKIENKHFYTLYGMCSQDMNVFYFNCFNDGYFLFYLNDCLSGEQLKVTDEYTMIGVASSLHIELPQVNIPSSLEPGTYYTLKN